MKRTLSILFAIFLFSCLPNKKRLKERFETFKGIYKLNYSLTNQKRKILDSSILQEVHLHLFSDSTFKFTKKIDLFCSDTGRWFISNGGFEEWNNLRFIGCKEYFQFGELDVKNNFAIVVGGVGGLDGIDYLFFQKMK